MAKCRSVDPEKIQIVRVIMLAAYLSSIKFFKIQIQWKRLKSRQSLTTAYASTEYNH